MPVSKAFFNKLMSLQWTPLKGMVVSPLVLEVWVGDLQGLLGPKEKWTVLYVGQKIVLLLYSDG